MLWLSTLAKVSILAQQWDRFYIHVHLQVARAGESKQYLGEQTGFLVLQLAEILFADAERRLEARRSALLPRQLLLCVHQPRARLLQLS